VVGTLTVANTCANCATASGQASECLTCAPNSDDETAVSPAMTVLATCSAHRVLTGPTSFACLSCSSGCFLLAATTCVSCPASCTSCTADNICSACISGRHLTSAGTCAIDCGAGQQQFGDELCGVCEDRCLTCSGPTSNDCIIFKPSQDLGQLVTISARWISYETKILYTFTPSFQASILSNAGLNPPILSVEPVEPTYGLKLSSESATPLTNCQPSIYTDSTTCDAEVNIPSDQAIQSVQVVMSIFTDISDGSKTIKQQQVYLETPISIYLNKALDTVSQKGGESIQYTVLGSTIIGLSVGSSNFLQMLKLMSFVEVMLYFDVDYPSCAESMFQMFRDSSQIGFLSKLLLGNSAKSNACQLPYVFAKRGHTSCSMVSRQLMFYFIVGILAFIKLMCWVISKRSSESTESKSIFAKINEKLNFEYFYNYIDAYFFGISLESFISLTSAKSSYYSINIALFYADKLTSSFTILSAFIIIVLGIAFIYKNSKSKKKAKLENSGPLQPNSPKESAFNQVLKNYEFMLKRNFKQEKFHGEYILPAVQLKSVLSSLVVVILQKSPAAHIILVTCFQAAVVYFTAYRRNFKEYREWLVNITMHSGLLFCYILCLSLVFTSQSSISPSTLYFSIGMPIVFIIGIIFLINVINMILSAVDSIREYLKPKSNKVKQNQLHESKFGLIDIHTPTPLLSPHAKQNKVEILPRQKILNKINGPVPFSANKIQDKRSKVARIRPKKIYLKNENSGLNRPPSIHREMVYDLIR
jgi:hypothetical protein